MEISTQHSSSPVSTQKLIFTDDWSQALIDAAAPFESAGVWLVTDSNVDPLISDSEAYATIPAERRIVIPAGEENKNLTQTGRVWEVLTRTGASRKSLIVCVGGGMVTDLGGFAAACFKRGVSTIVVPTTLLGAVDASVGGKTGIDFHDLKNEIGAFHTPQAAIISPRFLSSLPRNEILSGLGEMLKMALISSERVAKEFISRAPHLISEPEHLYKFVREMVEKKLEITQLDPREGGLRKVLNLGHTAGHAFETLAMRRGEPVPHGCAVAVGLVAELALACLYGGLESKWLDLTARCVRDLFPPLKFGCKDYDEIFEIMLHDKKNQGDGMVGFVMLQAPGHYDTDGCLGKAEIEAGLDVMRDLTGI